MNVGEFVRAAFGVERVAVWLVTLLVAAGAVYGVALLYGVSLL